MIQVHRIVFLMAMAFLTLAAIPADAAKPHSGTNAAWFVGFWHLTADEDKVKYDLNEFRADGTWADYDRACKPTTAHYHVYGRDIYVTFETSKGPIAVVYRPNAAHTQLVYTSIRTRHNATYERAPDGCKPASAIKSAAGAPSDGTTKTQGAG